MKLPDGPEILRDCGPFDGSKDDTDNTGQKRAATDKLLKRRDKFFSKAARRAARSAKEGKAEEGPRVMFDDTGPPSFESEQFEFSGHSVGRSIKQNAAEAVGDDANNDAAQALPSNRPGDRRSQSTASTLPAGAADRTSDVSNRDLSAPLQLRNRTNDVSYQFIQSHNAETGIQFTSSLFMADVVATRVGDDLVFQATPMEPSRLFSLTNAIKKHRLCVMAALSLIVTAVVTSVIVLTHPKGMTSSDIRNEAIKNAVIAVSGNSVLDATTSQGKAVTWLLEGGARDFSPDDPRLIQRYVLALLYHSLGGGNWYDKHLFLTGANECAWSKYFECQNSMIEKIDLSNNNLKGSLPSEIGALTYLQTLDLNSNQLYDSIPQHVTMLSALQSLVLWNNSLTGSIPEIIAGMSTLQQLKLSRNQLTGTIPTSVVNLVSLKLFQGSDNLLKGSIPSEFGRMTHLEEFSVNNNKLTGIIPIEIGQLTHLVNLWINVNFLDGSIPSEIGRLTALNALSININNLTGTIPTEIEQLTNLGLLLIDSNPLHGSIPSEIGRLTALNVLSIHGNNLTGSIPTEIGLLTHMTTFYVNNNKLTGSMPSSVCNLDLKELHVDCKVNCSCCNSCL